MATILAPTDAALGQAVVNDPRIPTRVRQALNIEIGLNDGLALPALLFFIAAANQEAPQPDYWLAFVGLQLVVGPLVGLGVGYGGGKLLPLAVRDVGTREVAYALLSLTAVRLLSVALSMTRSGTRATTWLFVGWFGPRGLASIIYLMLLHEQGFVRLHGALFGVVITTVA